jgi:SAM-dependent methyltransferase
MSQIVGVVRTSLLRAGRAFELGARVCSSLAAATLRLSDIRSDTEVNWGHFHTFDAEIDQGLFPWEQHLVERFVRSGDRILIVGCGTGRDLIELSAKGHEVTGVEPSALAVDIAQAACLKRGVAAEIVQGYFEDATLSDRFDVIMFSYVCYGYIPESVRRIDALRKARTLLAADGRILISYTGNHRRRSSRLIEVMKVGTRWLRSDWHPEQGDVLHPMSNGQPRFHYEHIFVSRELQTEAAAAGLRVIFDDDSTFDYWLAVLADAG